MKVKELIEELQRFSPDAKIGCEAIMSEDDCEWTESREISHIEPHGCNQNDLMIIGTRK